LNRFVAGNFKTNAAQASHLGRIACECFACRRRL